MKNSMLLTVLLFAFTSFVVGQDTLYSCRMNQNIHVWDSHDFAHRQHKDIISFTDPVVVLTDVTYGTAMKFYLLADSSGFVVSKNLCDTQVVTKKVSNSNNTRSTPTYVDPCAKAEYYRQRYLTTASTIDMDKYRMWLAKCYDKKY